MYYLEIDSNVMLEIDSLVMEITGDRFQNVGW